MKKAGLINGKGLIQQQRNFEVHESTLIDTVTRSADIDVSNVQVSKCPN